MGVEHIQTLDAIQGRTRKSSLAAQKKKKSLAVDSLRRWAIKVAKGTEILYDTRIWAKTDHANIIFKYTDKELEWFSY